MEGHTRLAERLGLFYTLQEVINLEENPQFVVTLFYLFAMLFLFPYPRKLLVHIPGPCICLGLIRCHSSSHHR